MCSPSGWKATAETDLLCPLKVWTGASSPMRQSFAVVSQEPVRMCSPSGWKATAKTESLCPLKVWTGASSPMRQSFAVVSTEPVRMCSPSGWKATGPDRTTVPFKSLDGRVFSNAPELCCGVPRAGEEVLSIRVESNGPDRPTMPFKGLFEQISHGAGFQRPARRCIILREWPAQHRVFLSRRVPQQSDIHTQRPIVFPRLLRPPQKGWNAGQRPQGIVPPRRTPENSRRPSAVRLS